MIIFPGPSVQQFSDSIVSIDGLLLGVDLEGVAWVFEELDGWLLGGGVDASFDARPSTHGNFDAQVYRRARILTIKGACVADSPALAEDACDTLASLLADGRMGTFSVQNSRRTLSCSVRLSDTPLSEPLSANAFRWSLQFTAPDRRRYGEQFSQSTTLPGGVIDGLDYALDYPLDYGDPGASGRVSFTNTGNASTEPVLTIHAPLAAGFEVAQLETGRRLRYEHPVTQPLIIDNAAGTARVDGQPRERFLTVREWFTVGPKQTSTFQFTSLAGESALSSSASMVLSVSPAFN